MAETVESLLAEGRERLSRAPFAPSTREAALLLGRATGLSEAQLLARGEREPPAEEIALYRSLLERRLTGEPVAYLFGEREFWGRPFAVDARVLIPRPETEHLIEAALELELPARPRILDVGTGSGCIAVTLALEIPGARVVAGDISPGALAVAALNHRRHAVTDRVGLVATDLTAALELGHFDLVVANPPYVDLGVRSALSREVTEFEPSAAVFAPGPSWAVLERLAAELAALGPATPILLEIGFDQSQAIGRIAATAGLELVEILDDLAGHPRVAVLACRP